MISPRGIRNENEPPTEVGGSFRCMELDSDQTDVLGFLALATRGDIELDLLSLIERPVAIALDAGEVDEDVVTLFPRNEAEALLGVEPLDGACSQKNLSSVLSRSV
jgi:hypothetical protein